MISINHTKSPPTHQNHRFPTMPNLVGKARTGLLVTFTVLAFLFFFKSYPSRTADPYSHDFEGEGYPRIAKVSMLYGKQNFIYERALRSHRMHDDRHNYPFWVLRHELTGGYWNKPSYLLSLIVSELAKPPGQRVEWLMWVDADLVLINPSIPLEVFLPPFDFPDVHFLGNKDHHGLNTGTFFLRVHEWSIKFLTKAIALPMFRPELDLHVSADQEAMSHVLNETDFSSNVLYQPRIWYNTYEWHHAYEGKKGNLLVHFPGLDDDRWKHMNDWLMVVEQDPRKWDVPLEDTFYPNVTSTYWSIHRAAKKQLHAAEVMLGEKGDKLDKRVEPGWEMVKRAVLFEGDALKAVRAATEELEKILDQVRRDEALGLTQYKNQPPQPPKQEDQPKQNQPQQQEEKPPQPAGN